MHREIPAGKSAEPDKHSGGEGGIQTPHFYCKQATYSKLRHGELAEYSYIGRIVTHSRHAGQLSLFLRPVVKCGVKEASMDESRKLFEIVRYNFQTLEIGEVVEVVRGRGRAEGAVESRDKKLTPEEGDAGWRYFLRPASSSSTKAPPRRRHGHH